MPCVWVHSPKPASGSVPYVKRRGQQTLVQGKAMLSLLTVSYGLVFFLPAFSVSPGMDFSVLKSILEFWSGSASASAINITHAIVEG